MIGIDTNIWIRYVANDDPMQARRAFDLLKNCEDVFLPKTVLLEIEWVLRAVYGLPAPYIERAMLKILGLPNVQVENPGQVSNALDFYRGGLDFADALHLAGSDNVEAFFTFDEKFVKAAQKLGRNVITP